MYRDRSTIKSLRREIVGDSLEREKAMTKLLKLVRADERNKTIEDLTNARAQRERDGA